MLAVMVAVASRRSLVLAFKKKYGILTGVRDVVLGFYLGGVFLVPEIID